MRYYWHLEHFRWSAAFSYRLMSSQNIEARIIDASTLGWSHEGNHFFHPLSFHPFSNSCSENLCTAQVRARCLNASSSAVGSVSASCRATAKVSGVVAWKPVRYYSYFRLLGVCETIFTCRLSIERDNNIKQGSRRCMYHGYH